MITTIILSALVYEVMQVVYHQQYHNKPQPPQVQRLPGEVSPARPEPVPPPSRAQGCAGLRANLLCWQSFGLWVRYFGSLGFKGSFKGDIEIHVEVEVSSALLRRLTPSHPQSYKVCSMILYKVQSVGP